MSVFLKQNKGKIVLRFLTAFILVAMLLWCGNIEAFAKTQNDLQAGKTYTVPVESLTSKAPLKPIKEAFSNAFGDSIIVTVDDNGNETATVKNHHMVIDVGPLGTGVYQSNVRTIKDSEVVSTKSETFSNSKDGLRNPSVTETVEVPDEFTFPLNTDEESEQVLTITVDFMDAFLGGGKPYETDVTLKLNFDGATEKINQQNTDKELINGDASTSDNDSSVKSKLSSVLENMKLLENNKPTSLTYIIGVALIAVVVLIIVIVRKNRV